MTTCLLKITAAWGPPIVLATRYRLARELLSGIVSSMAKCKPLTQTPGNDIAQMTSSDAGNLYKAKRRRPTCHIAFSHCSDPWAQISTTVFSLAWALCKAGSVRKASSFGLRPRAQSKAELAAEVLIVRGHSQGQPHVLLEELLCGHLAAVQADGERSRSPPSSDTCNQELHR